MVLIECQILPTKACDKYSIMMVLSTDVSTSLTFCCRSIVDLGEVIEKSTVNALIAKNSARPTGQIS